MGSHANDGRGQRAMGIWVGRYSMVTGEPSEASPWLVDRQRLGDEDAVRLVVLTEPADETSAPFCAEVAEAVAALFGREFLSITGGLLRALQQAHTNLVEWNHRSLREHHVAIGVSCVAIRDGEATIALAGPGAIYTSGLAGVTRLTTEGTPAAQPLGGNEPIAPHFLTVPFRDIEILLLTSNAEHIAGEQIVAQALTTGPERALGELYPRTRHVRDMCAVLIADIDVESDEPSPIIAAPTEPTTVPPAPIDSGTGPLESVLHLGRPLPTVRRPPRVFGTPGPAPAQFPWKIIGWVSAALVAFGLFASLVLPSILNEDRDQRIDELIAQVTVQMVDVDQAQAAGDRTAERISIEQASATLERMMAQTEDDPRISVLADQIATARMRLDAVINIKVLTLIVRLDRVLTVPAQPQALVAGGKALWLLERERGRIVRLDPTNTATHAIVYQPGEQYGGVTGRPPLALAWDEDHRRLLVLDKGRTLFAIPGNGEKNSLTVLTVRGVEEIRAVAGLATYTGNLYLLDPEGREVWRYLPAGEGFDSERQGLLGGADITNARALAVDGDLYLLQDGALRHFRLGEELAELFAGIDAFPKAVAGIAEDRLRGIIYIGDRENNRIVVSDRAGSFLRQYHHVDFDDLRSLALQPDGERLYVLTGRSVFVFNPLADISTLPLTPTPRR